MAPRNNLMPEGQEPLIFPLEFMATDDINPQSLSIPVIYEVLAGRTSVEMHELAMLAFERIPKDLKEYRQRVANRLDYLEQRPGTTLEVRGPDEGDLYIILPEEASGDNGEDPRRD